MARRAERQKPEETQGQDAIFRGTSGGDAKLKDARSVIGTPNRVLPAFVLGEELADIADKAMGDWFLRDILKEGKVLYESSGR